MKPTSQELFDAAFEDSEDIVEVAKEEDPSWRHGCYVTQVFHRKSDDTYWEAQYRRSTDYETDELREGSADIVQVTPRTETVVRTVYDKVKA